MFACRSFIDIEIGYLQETGSAKEQRFAVANIFTQQSQRKPLRENREGKLVFLVTERTRDLLKKRFVASVVLDLISNSARFLSQTELRCGIQHAAHALVRQIFERCLTPPRSSERDVCGKCFRQRRGVDAHLRDIAVRFRPREKFAVTSFDKNVKHSRFEGWIDRVTMCFPTAIKQIDLDATANRLAATYSNSGIAKVRTSFAVPSAELDNIDLVSSSANKMFAEISGKPARLQLQLGWDARRDEKRAFAYTGGIARLRVAFCEGAHGQIMRRARPNVTHRFGVRGYVRALKAATCRRAR